MDLMDFIGENTYLVAVVLWVVGTFLKAIPSLSDWLIPFVLTALGIGLCVGLMGASADAVIQGILCAGGAVLANQMGKQVKKAGTE